MRGLVTTLGGIDLPARGVILPHEHVFVDLRTPDTPGHGEADTAAVVALMAPLLRSAREAGVAAIVDAGPVGVGRRADILRAVSEAAGVPLLVPTGVYREPWIPGWVHEADEERLHAWMAGELGAGIGDTGVRAGWIKLSAGDDGMTPCERKVLRAAARAAAATGAAIGSHTIRGTWCFGNSKRPSVAVSIRSASSGSTPRSKATTPCGARRPDAARGSNWTTSAARAATLPRWTCCGAASTTAWPTVCC